MTYQTLVDVLRERARDRFRDRAFTFLTDGEVEGDTLTYGELDVNARSIAAALRSHGLIPGERALLLYPPGLEFISAFFGCLYAGIIAVPAYPPQPSQLARTLPRLLSIIADADVAIVLCDASVSRSGKGMSAHAPALVNIPWLSTDRLGASRANEWTGHAISRDHLAFLQYTSGSTASPRGVMVSHANLLHNLDYARRQGGNGPGTVSVSWLPVIHDMGLIEGVLQPIFAGYPAHLMAPASFLQRPMRWLRAITRYRATNSGAPNFAYDLCVRKVSDDQLPELDLSSWRIAYNGAEPIRRETLLAFHERFRSVGFRWRSFFPVYGLAESTLLVSTGDCDYEPVMRDVDAGQLAAGRVVAAVAGAPTKSLVSSGPHGSGTRVLIVDPATTTPCADGEVGEIWVSSPSVARGYWRRDIESAETFRARLADGRGPFLRTGDLGTMIDGELFVTGRAKDIIVIRGYKYYPQDIELTAERLHPAIRGGCSAAFALDGGDTESVGLAVELDPRQLPIDQKTRVRAFGEIVDAVRAAIATEHGVNLSLVALVGVGGVPKTSSGKLRRSACRDAAMNGSLDEVARWTALADIEWPGTESMLLRTGT
jgi:acyl-CoA synthetase (AMP-forming)/AMP-acid ligase II